MNEDEFSEVLGVSINLSDAIEILAGLRKIQNMSQAENIMVHTSAWALIIGPRAQELAPALRSAIDVSSARFAHGDNISSRTVEQIRFSPRVSIAEELKSEIEALADDVHLEVGYDLRPENPTTIGLGDAYLGGFVKGLL